MAGFTFPDFTIAHTLLALTGSGQYPLDRGQPVTSAGAAFPVQDFERHIDESHMPHSTALHATLDGGPYLTGPLARYALNHAALSPLAREAARSAGLEVARDNPFRSIVARAVELV